MAWDKFLVYLLVMAGVTYLIRMLPLAAVRGKVRSVFLQSFLYYVPYAVLGAMTFPAIFSSTGSWITALCGTVAALALGWMGKKPAYRGGGSLRGGFFGRAAGIKQENTA